MAYGSAVSLAAEPISEHASAPRSDFTDGFEPLKWLS